jgi:single-stranded-DNA-specific exonuclease
MHAAVKTWHLLPHDPDAIAGLATALRVAPIVAHLLQNRGLADPDRARRFLETPLNGLHPPERLPGVTAAADRLLAAVRAGRRVCVYGDYDVDGLTGTALLLQALRLVGAADVDHYVPHRLEEGYGLNAAALRQIAEGGAGLVITVDCGIASVVEAEEAARLGLELIITDHHEPKDRLPGAAVLVHPRLPDGSYPFDKLSGAAVAFKVAWALCQRYCGSERVTPRFREYLLDAVALAALGIVADVVPLHDENRILVKHGLARLRTAPPPGVRALLESSGLPAGAGVKAADIGFKLAPRLNAAGRLGCARLVVELLTTTSPERAADLARYLDDQNQKRQTMERRILSEARSLAAGCDTGSTPALVLAHPEWHAGVIGIVAGRLADQYARPVLMIALRRERGEGPGPDADGGPVVGQGSGRSVPGFPLHEALRACEEHLLSHGGHTAAAGFKIHPDRVDVFREQFCAYAARHFPSGPPAPRLVIDAEVPLSVLTYGLLEELDRLEPYGAANTRPLFLAGGLEVLGTPRRIGQGERHMSFRVRQRETAMRAIAFGMGDRLEELLSAGGRCCLVFTPRINEWNGYRSVELEVADFQPGAEARLG